MNSLIYESIYENFDFVPPDPDSCKQTIKRVHCQSYYWDNCLQPIINPINVEENVTNYEGDKDSGTSLKKTPKKRMKRSTKDAISSKTKKYWKKLLKESRENPDSESDD